MPGWTDFRKLVSLIVSFPTSIGNCRTVPASPTDLNLLRNIKRMLQNIGQSDIAIAGDQSIYQIAKQIQWVIPSLADTIIRLGGFHVAKN